MKKHLSKELDHYLSKKGDDESRFVELLDYVQVKAAKGEKNDSQVIIIKEKSNFQYYLDKTLGKLKKKKVAETEDISDEEIEEVEEQPETWWENTWNKIKEFFTPIKEEDEDEESPEEEHIELEEPIREDLKKIALFTKQLLAKLPRREIQGIKESDDFKEFKAILRKYKIIKE